MPRRLRPRGQISAVEVVAIIAVIGALAAAAVWFLFFSGGGIGPGTV